MTINLNLQQKTSQQQQQIQRLMMLPKMQQAINILQTPAMEMAPLVEAHLTLNPIIEIDDDPEEETEGDEEEAENVDSNQVQELTFDENDFAVLSKMDEEFRDSFIDDSTFPKKRSREDAEHQSYLESSVISPISLADHLLHQAHDSFADDKDVQASEILIGYLDREGFLNHPLSEIAALHHLSVDRLKSILAMIQTFDPYGVGAENIQESLLIQLNCCEKKNSLAAVIIRDHFDDLLHNHIPAIQRKLHCTQTDLEQAMQEIAHLNLHPGTSYASTAAPQYIIPDITLREDENGLHADINDDYLPPMRINRQYLQLMRNEDTNAETKQYISKHIDSAKWLIKNILQRNDTLKRIAEYIVKTQQSFLTSKDGKLKPMTMRQAAEELSMHESTVARAVSNKYLDCDRGLLHLRDFFTTAYSSEQGDNISSKTIQDVILNLIQNEDPHHPLSDAAISEELKKQKIDCARRTIAKYRGLLKLGNTQQRRKYT